MASKTSTPRSSKYPSFGLGKAIELAEKVHTLHSTVEIDKDTIGVAMGYATGGSGPASSAIATVRQYGLFEVSRKGHYRATKALVDILLAEGVEQIEALRTAAALPKVFQEIKAAYAGRQTPSQDSLEKWLQRNEFTRVAAPKCAKAYLDTEEYMGDKLVELNPDLSPPSSDTMAPAEQVTTQGETPMPIPQRATTTWLSGALPGGATFSVIATGPVSEAGLKNVRTLLEANIKMLGDGANGASHAEGESSPSEASQAVAEEAS